MRVFLRLVFVPQGGQGSSASPPAGGHSYAGLLYIKLPGSMFILCCATLQGGLGGLAYPLVADITKSISKDYGVLVEEGERGL